MKVAITDGKGNLWIEEVPIPQINDYQCLCKILACATCTGTDIKIIEGRMFWLKDYPVMLGHESVGKVIKKGKKVKYINEEDLFLRPCAVYPGEKSGDFYSAIGGFAEYGLILDTKAFKEDNPEKDINSYSIYQQKISLDILPPEATMLITLKETSSFLFNIGVKLNSSVAILGSGPVGMALCYFSKILGSNPVIAIGRNKNTLNYIKKLGADYIIITEDENIEKTIKEITKDKGMDFIIDTTGNKKFVLSLITSLSEKGKICPYASYENEDVFKEYKEDKRFMLTNPEEPLANDYIHRMINLNCLTPSVFYSKILPFSEIKHGFELLKRKEEFKIVFTMEE
jgi:L-iditol 2-dehydrogenase